MTSRFRSVCALLSAALICACGGRVNLGGKRDNSAPPSDEGATETPGPDAPVGKPVAQLAEDIQVSLLAVTNDDFLYVGNFFGMSRCRKEDCIPTLELLPSVGTSVQWISIYERSLAVAHGDGAVSSFATYGLPTMVEEAVVLRDLPGVQHAPFWYRGYLFFAQADDSNIYRCELPDCAKGPEKVGKLRNNADLSALGESLFWHDESFIYRSDSLGAVPPVTLLPDESLSEEPSGMGKEPAQVRSDSIEALATGPGKLYAVVGHPTTSPGCSGGGCSHSIFRWPAEGGAREEVITVAPGSVDRIFVFGDELLWNEAETNQAETFAVWSCLASACSATRRRLGTGARFGFGEVVADSSTVFWLEAGNNPTATEGSVQFTNRQIRRAPRLDPAQ